MRVLAASLALALFCIGCGESGGSGPAGPGETPFWATPEPGARPKVLLVGWDGVRPDVLEEVPTPNFDALAAGGTFSEEAVTARPTVSGPCCTRRLTKAILPAAMRPRKTVSAISVAFRSQSSSLIPTWRLSVRPTVSWNRCRF